ncbi:MAG: phosphotransferase family protein, partial [Mesorhizobium sp.]
MSGDANASTLALDKSALALDKAALAPYLEAHIPGFAGLTAIEKFKSGQSNPTYLLTAASGRYV